MFFGHRAWVLVLAQTYELRVSEMVCSSPGLPAILFSRS